MVRRSDRYVLREMIGPFTLALAGLILFILLNIILSLSDLMVDRGITLATLFRLILLKVPALLVVAVPMSALFAVFLGLGRMTHDQEIIALESLGISLKRILLPLILVASLVGIADFAVYNYLVPASESAYQDALRGVIFSQGAPRITANAFFRGPNDQFFYIRRYDETTGTLSDVHIYDTTGQLFPQAGTQVTMITAPTGAWTGGEWRLTDATVYGFDRDGTLVFTASVASLDIPIDQGIADLLSRSRTPTEMGIGELHQRIVQARANGQQVDEYVVEANLKLSLPLATVIFVLLGGGLSLAFLPRSRAAGVVLGLLLVAIFQGVLWWTQTLGRRGAMNPTLAAWLPDILFGLLGLFLFARVDRLASHDVWSRLRVRLPFLSLVVLLFSFPGMGQQVPIHLESDQLFVADDHSRVEAKGSVTATLDSAHLAADDLVLEKVQSASWRVTASGHVSLDSEDGMDLDGDSLTAEVTVDSTGVVTRSATATDFSGRSPFTNSAGEVYDIFFQASEGVITYDEEGEIQLLEARNCEITTCSCCAPSLTEQPYSLKAQRLLLYPDKLIVAFGLTGKAAGAAVIWLPLYVQPLQETLEAPLFPAFGTSALRGWFVKWNLPFFLSESLYGAVLIDYFSRFSEIGIGGVVRYDLFHHDGRVSFYVFPAKVGDSETQLDWRDSFRLADNWEGTGRVQYEAIGDEEDLTFSGRVETGFEEGEVSVSASREIHSTTRTLIEERFPELTLNLNAQRVGPVTVKPKISAGWYREWEAGTDPEGRFRINGRLAFDGDGATIAGFRISPEATAEAALYTGRDGQEEQESVSLSASASREGLRLTWNSTLVRGSSPFEFDRVTAEHQLRWSIEEDVGIDLSLSGSYTLGEGPGPLLVSADWGTDVSWSLDGEIDLALSKLTSLVLRGDWSDDTRSVDWKIPYLPSEGRFKAATVDLSAEVGSLTVSLDNEIDLNKITLTSSDLSSELTLDGGWGLSLGVYYVAALNRLSNLEFGLFKDMAGCLRIGVEYSVGELWLYVSILAFPEAVLRYAPTTSQFEIGD
jgi:lipopolysaccharide export system permease protein